MYRKTLSRAIRRFDSGVARFNDWALAQSSGLIIFTFHSLFTTAEEIDCGAIDPQQGITVEMFQEFIENFHRHGYQFVTPEEIVNGLDPHSRSILITFDDGYYNNFRALPVLEEFNAAAVFCVSTDFVRTGKAFWWDALYREAKKRRWTSVKLDHIRNGYKRNRTCDIEEALISEFGGSVLDPVGDLDRPMTAVELATLSRHPLCSIGNHTVDHAILTNYGEQQIHQQIAGAQEFVQQTTGTIPKLIAYPNGNLSPMVLRITGEVGLPLGVTVQPGRNKIADFNHSGSRSLKRFTLWGNRPVATQCRTARSAFSVENTMAGWKRRFSLSPTN